MYRVPQSKLDWMTSGWHINLWSFHIDRIIISEPNSDNIRISLQSWCIKPMCHWVIFMHAVGRPAPFITVKSHENWSTSLTPVCRIRRQCEKGQRWESLMYFAICNGDNGLPKQQAGRSNYMHYWEYHFALMVINSSHLGPFSKTKIITEYEIGLWYGYRH